MSDSNVKAFFALLMIGALITGFFMGLIDPQIFCGFLGIVITHYFKNEETKKLREQIVQKDEQLMSLSTTAQSLALNGKNVQ